MPTSFQIRPHLRLVEARYTGTVSISDIRELTARILDDPQFRPDFRALIDIAGVQPDFKSMDIVQHQQWRKQRPPFAKIAVVATTDFEFGFARMFELASNSAGGNEMRTFRDMAAARHWLDLPGPEAK